MVILSKEAKEAVLSVSYEEASQRLEANRPWIVDQLSYLEAHSPNCYTVVFGHSPFMVGVIQSAFNQIVGLDPLRVFHGQAMLVDEVRDLRLDFSEETLDALYDSKKERFGSALVNCSLEILTSEQGRAMIIGLHKRLMSRGRVLIIMERGLCVKEHLELLDEDYFDQLISPYFMMENSEETQLDKTHYKIYQLRAI